MRLELIAMIISLLTPFFIFLGRNTILEWIKSSFAKDIEHLKHDLELKKELLKQDLNREAQKIAHLSTGKQSLYPELYEKLRICEGTVAILHGLRLITDLDQLGNIDLLKMIQDSKLYDSLKISLSAKLNENRTEGIKAIKEAFRNLEFFEAKRACQETKNFLIIKSLYFSSSVRDLGFEVLKTMNSIIIDVELMPHAGVTYEQLQEQQENVESLLTQIEQEMRLEIFGSN